MAKAAIIVLADTETHADLGRVTNALETATECTEAGDDVRLVFDGAGTKWIDELRDEDHPSHERYRAVRDAISVCAYCADAFDVRETVAESPVDLVADYEGHPSIRQFVADGYEVITF